MGMTENDINDKTARHLNIGVFGMEISLVDNGVGSITSDLREEFMPDIEELKAEFDLRRGPIGTEYGPCPTCGCGKPIKWDCPCCGMEVGKAKASADALESFILALACEGYDVTSSSFICALETAVEAIGNNLS
jgi:hypothetical protein